MTSELRDPTAVRGDHSNILFLASPFTPGSRDWCTRLLSLPNPREYVLLFVLTTETPDNRLQAFRSHDDMVVPRQIGFVNLRGSTRFGDGDPSINIPGGESDITVETVSDAGDLTRVGIAIVKLLEWADSDLPIVVCFDSLTTLLQYVDPSTMYRFLDILTGRVNRLGATAHYHLDPSTRESQEVNRLLPLFDAVVEYDDLEEWQVRTR